MKIRTKLSFFSIALAVIMLIVSLLIIFIVNNHAIKAQIKNHLLITVQSRANHIKTLLNNYKKITLTFAAGNLVKNAVDESLDSSLRKQQINIRINSIIDSYPEIETIRILDKKGFVIVSSGKDIGTDKSNNETFINGKTNIYIREIHRSEFSSNIVISISAPIFVKDKFSGVIFINFRADVSLYQLLTDKTGLGKTGKTFLVNKELYLVSPYSSNYDIKEILRTKIGNEQVDSVFFEHIEEGFPEDMIEKVIEYTDYKGKKEIALHYYISHLQSLLIAEMDVKEAYKPLYTQTYLLIIILFVLLVFIIIIGLLISRNITAPINKLHKGTEEIINGNLNYKVGTKANDEIGQLSRAFDLMTERLTKSQRKIQNRAGQLEGEVKVRTAELEKHFEKSEKQRIATLSILSDLNKVSKDLKKEKDRAERYLDLAGVMFVAINTNEVVTLVNKKGCETLGYDYDEIIGANWFDNFIPELNRHKVRYVFRELMAGRVEIVEYYENQIITKNGEIKTIAWHDILLKDEDGNVTGTLTSGEDITKRKMAEDENRNLIQMVEQSPAVVVLTDLSGNIKYVNPKFTEVSGYTFEEAIGQNPRVLKSGETSNSEYENLWEIITHGDVWHGEFHNKKKNGELYWEDATIGPIKNENGDITNYLAIKEDITNRKLLSGKLNQSQKLEAVGQFAGGIAHDFNNILQVIIGYVFFAEQDLSKDDPRFKNIEEIRKAADKAASLSHQLMAFSSSQVLEPRNININELIDSFLNMIRRIIGENIELKFVYEQNLNSVYADPSQMEQIIMNLCVNARDAMPNGGDLIIKTENILIGDEYCGKYQCEKKGEYVLITVSDTGLGMSQLVVDKIFEPFFTTKKENKGTGLGLATVFGIIKQHNGMINVYSEEGKGTIFKVYLPIGENKDNVLIKKNKSIARGGTETILIAEDDDSIKNLAIRILEGAGYTVIAASNGVEAVSFFEKNVEKIALVILDIVMPKMGGLEAFKCMEEIKPETKVLFCSGYSSKTFFDDPSVEKIKKMHKPYSRNALLNEVRKILDGND